MLNRLFKKKRKARASRPSTYYPSKTKRVTSRLAKREQKKLVNQSIVFLLLALLLGVIFVIFILPGSVNLLFNFLDSGEISAVDDSLPPQTPIVSTPDEASSDQTIEVSGFAQIENEVTLLLNGSEYAREIVDQDGEFAISVDLEEGKNLIALYASNDKGKESGLSKEYEVIYDAQAPEIEISSPEPGTNFEGKNNQNIEILGQTEPGTKLYVNDRLTFSNSEGEFKSSYRLEEGENKILIKAMDKAGNETESELSVSFRF
ncbi:MAG: hypothetical protein ABFQ62_03600 [Patescibacteria group bacterium]